MENKVDKRCCGTNGAGGGMIAVLAAHSFPDFYRCDYNGKYFEKGKWWCGKHAPSKIAEREAKSLATTYKNIEKWRERKSIYDEENAKKNI